MKQALYVVAVVVGLTAVETLSAGNEPTDDSNFSFQSGAFSYLPSYLASNTPVFGTIIGQATLTRMARLSQTRLEISFAIGNQPDFGGVTPDEIAVTDFTFKLHSEACVSNGGEVYQHPLLCTQGCTPEQVDAVAATSIPLEIEITTGVSPPSNNVHTAHTTFSWPVHIPNDDTPFLSMVLYDPRNNARMMCTDLAFDRQQEGQLFFINEAVSEVPSVQSTKFTRDEIGTTVLELSIVNLAVDTTYPVSLFTQPCAINQGHARFQFPDCGDFDGGCDAPELILTSDGDGFAVGTRRFAGIAGANAQSLIVGVACDSASCDTTETFLCLDLHNEIIDFDSTTTAGVIPTRPETTTAAITATLPEQPFETSVSPSTSPPTTSLPTFESKGQVTVSPTTYPTLAPFAARVIVPEENPCPSIHTIKSARGKGGKKGRKSQHSQLDYSSTNQCCLPVTPPSMLLSFEMQHSKTLYSISLLTTVIGVAGLTLIVSAVVSIVLNRRQQNGNGGSRFGTFDEYAIPSNPKASDAVFTSLSTSPTRPTKTACGGDVTDETSPIQFDWSGLVATPPQTPVRTKHKNSHSEASPSSDVDVLMMLPTPPSTPPRPNPQDQNNDEATPFELICAELEGRTRNTH